MDDHAEDTAPKDSTLDIENADETPVHESKENVDESHPFEANSDTVTYDRSMDDTTVSEMTNPTVFQSRPMVESPDEEDAGVLQETSANVDSQKSSNQASSEAEKSKSAPDPFNATSVFSSGDPFGMLAAERSAGASISEGASFGDPFYTPLQSEQSVATTPKAGVDTKTTDLTADPPLEVVDMASSDEDDEVGHDKPPTITTQKKAQTTPKSKGGSAFSKQLKVPTSPIFDAKEESQYAMDDPPLDAVDMESSEDEPSECNVPDGPKEPTEKSVEKEMPGTPGGVATVADVSNGVRTSYEASPAKDSARRSTTSPTTPPNPILLSVKKRKEQRKVKAPVPGDMAGSSRKSRTNAKLTTGDVLTIRSDAPSTAISSRQADRAGDAAVRSPSERSRSDTNLSSAEGRSDSVSVSSSSRQVHPAAEAAGKSASQRARILAKHRRSRGEPTVTVDPDRRRSSQTGRSAEETRFSHEKVAGNGSSSREAPIRTKSSAAVSEKTSADKETTSRAIPEQSRKAPVQTQSIRTYAVERPRSILKKIRLALPTESNEFMVRPFYFAH